MVRRARRRHARRRHARRRGRRGRRDRVIHGMGDHCAPTASSAPAANKAPRTRGRCRHA
jgi:hypothetical protein